MAAKRLPRLNGFWLLSVLIGVLLLVSISFYSANTDIATAEDALSTRVDYIKEQCADYSSLNLASEAKSLLRVTESAQQCARDIWYLTEKPDDLYPAAEDVLPHFVENHYLTGLLLLSRDGQITKSYCKEEALLPLLNKVLTTDSLLDVADHPKKTYAVRLVCGDDSFLDIAASAREGADCIIVAFYHTPAEYVHTYKLSYQHLVSGSPARSAASLTGWSMYGPPAWAPAATSATPRRAATTTSTPFCRRPPSLPQRPRTSSL